MRPIKFRCKNDDGEWVDITLDYILSEEGSALYDFVHGPYRQFTGLHDKNGKEIYEGDIVKYKSGNVVVKWLDIGMYNICPLTDAKKNQARIFKEYIECEIIGNIYENPELIE